MKKRIRKILAFLICTVILASCFVVLVAADSSLGYNVGIFQNATASVTMYGVYKDTGELVSSYTYAESFSLSYGSPLFLDSWHYTARNRLGFEGLGDIFCRYASSGIGCDYAVVDITLDSPVPFDYTWIYSSNPSLFPSSSLCNVVDKLQFVLKSSTGSVTYADATFGYADAWYSSSALSYIGYSLTGFRFEVTPNILQYPRSSQMRDLARYFANSTIGNGYGEDLLLFELWADDGMYRYLYSDLDAQIQYANSTGYVNGYQSGLNSGYANGYDKGLTEGEEVGYGVGYDEGLTEGEKVGYESGYSSGESAGYSAGYKNGVANTKQASEKQLQDAYDRGKNVGYMEGVQDGTDTDVNMHMGRLFTEIIDAPVNVILGMLHFEFLGFELDLVFRALFTILVLAAVFVLIGKVIF